MGCCLLLALDAVGTWKYLQAKAVDLPSDRLLRIGYSVFVEPNSKYIVFADGVFIAIIFLNHTTLVWGLPRDRVQAPRLCQISVSRMVQVENFAWKSNLRWTRAWNKGAERNMICLPTSQSQKNHHTALRGNWSPEVWLLHFRFKDLMEPIDIVSLCQLGSR